MNTLPLYYSVLLTLVIPTTQQPIPQGTLSQGTCDSELRRAQIQMQDAKVVLHGMLEMHEAGTGMEGCGPSNKDTMQVFEALRWSLQRLNLDTGQYSDSYIPGVKIGMNLYDTCSRPAVALDGLMETFPNTMSQSRDCERNSTQLTIGVIGPTQAETMKSTAEFLSGFSIPQIGIGTAQRDKNKYSTLLGTVASDMAKAKAAVDMLKLLEWNYTAVLYSEDESGQMGVKHLKEEASKMGIDICITYSAEVPLKTNNTLNNIIFQKLLQTGVTGVVYFGAKEPLKALLESSSANEFQWIAVGSGSLTDNVVLGNQIARGIVLLRPGSRSISDFESHWLAIDPNNPPSENHFYKDWYMTVNNCRLPGINYPPFSSYAACVLPSAIQRQRDYIQDAKVGPALFALYSYAKALKNAHRDKCGGSRGLCNALASMTKQEFFNSYLKSLDFRFGLDERITQLSSSAPPFNRVQQISYDDMGNFQDAEILVYNYNNKDGTFKIHKVGEFYRNKLQLSTDDIRMYNPARGSVLPTLPASPCPGGTCKYCQSVQKTSTTMYIPGDVILGIVTSVHGKGSGASMCGSIGPYGAEVAEAFNYALQRLPGGSLPTRSDMQGILNGVKIGGMVFDDCMDPALASTLLTSFHHGLTIYSDNMGHPITPSAVEAYSAALHSDTTVATANVLHDLLVPLVGYAATTTELSNMLRYPYFARTIPGDDKQAAALVNILKKMDWNHVQVVYEADSYGRTGLDELRKMAATEGICVVASYEFTTDGTVQEIITKLRSKADSQVVVVFAQSETVREFLSGMSDANAVGEFVLLGTDSWGKLQSVVKDNEAAASGAITVALKSSTISGFNDYLQNLNAENYTVNPWFKEWYEEAHKCYIDPSSNLKGFSIQCSNPATRPITSASGYQQNPLALHITNAVYAMAKGLHQTLTDLCGSGYVGVCPNFRNDIKKAKKLLQNIKRVSFTDESGSTFNFINGEGDVGYHIYNYQGNSVGYRRVGSFIPSSKSIQLNTGDIVLTNNLRNVSSSCAGPCSECLYLYQNQKFMYKPGQIIIGASAGVHGQGDAPFSCGDITRGTIDLQTAESIAYAIDAINAKSSPVNVGNVQFGMLFLDSCKSSVRESNLISSTHSGSLSFKHNDTEVDVSNIRAWISSDDESSEEVQRILGSLGLLQVSPFASSTTLKDTKKHPTFYSTIPADEKQTKAIAKLAKAMGWTSIQIVSDNLENSQKNVETLKQHAKDEGVCVSKTHTLVDDGNHREVVKKLLASSSARVVVVFTNNANEDIPALLSAKDAETQNTLDLVFIGGTSWGTSSTLIQNFQTPAEGSITFTVDGSRVGAFDNYLATKRPGQNSLNPWWDDYYEALFQCDLPGNQQYGRQCSSPESNPITNSNNYEQGSHVVHTLNAVYAIAQATQAVLEEKCGKDYTEVCKEFTNDADTNHRIVQEMAKVNFQDENSKSFGFLQREGKKGFIVHRYSNQQYRQIGFYNAETDKLQISDSNVANLYNGVTAECVGDCIQSCFGISAEAEKFTFVSGDVLIGGVFDVSDSGTSPFSCGAINDKYGVQLLEAFHFAIEEVNKKQGIFQGKLNGVNVGGLGVDACKSPNKAGNLVANIHSGAIRFKGDNNQVIDPNRIDTYVGGLSSDSTRRMADVLNVFGIPLITYGASTIDISDKTLYPYVLRTIPADDKQARAMIAILKRFGFKYVQVVSSRSDYGQPLADEFKRLAPKHDICVAQHLFMDMNNTYTAAKSAMDIVTKLKHKSALAVITIIDKRYVKTFLNAIKKDADARSRFFFVASNTWGRDPNVVTGVEPQAENAISLDIETTDVPKFDSYLFRKNPSNYDRNPWFSKFYEKIFNCNLPGGTKYEKDCADSTSSIVQAQSYKQDPYVLYVVNAVYSAALGIHSALQRLCGSSYDGVCDNFLTAGERRVDILAGIKQAKFVDDTNQEFSYTTNGDSNRGYHLYNLQKNALIPGSVQTYDFLNIGSYNDSSSLKIKSDFNVGWKSDCSLRGRCEECPVLGNQPNRIMQTRTAADDLNLIGVFDVHDQGDNIFECGPMNLNTGFQNLLAFFFAINRVNKDDKLKLPASIKLGGIAVDSCSSSLRARNDLYGLMSGQGICNIASGKDIMNPATFVSAVVAGSDNSIAANDVFDPLKLTYISQSGTSDTLSNAQIYRYFLRTVPPDSLQAKAMVDALQHFKWTYVTVVYSEGDYGINAKTAFLKEAENKTVCPGQSRMIPHDADLQFAKELLRTLSRSIGANVIVMFTYPKHSRLMLEAQKELGKNYEGRFIWLGSDYWADSQEIVKGYEKFAEGALTIRIRSENVQEFKDWLGELQPSNTKGVPDDWLNEWWQHMHKCRNSSTKFIQQQYTKLCTGKEKISEDMIQQDPYVLHTIIATYVIAQGLLNIPSCSANNDFAACLARQSNKYELIHEGIRNAQWSVLGQQEFVFRFTDEGYGDVAYEILNYKKKNENYVYEKIGFWLETLQIRGEYVGTTTGETTSVCPSELKCTCITTTSTSGNIEGNVGTYQRQLLKPPGVADRFKDIWGIIITVLTGLGVGISIMLFFYLLCAYPVRGGTSILGYYLLFGIIGVYLHNIVFIFYPNEVICTLRRLFLGLSYAVCFSALLLKMLNTWRLGENDNLQKYKRLSSPTSFFLIAVALTFVQVIIAVEWIILERPTWSTQLYDDRLWPRCDPINYHNEGLVMSCIYVMALIMATLGFAARTWDNQLNHYESRWVMILCLCVSGVWIAWVLVFLLADLPFHDPAVAIANVVNATLMLGFIYIRKLYLLSRYKRQMHVEKKTQKVLQAKPPSSAYRGRGDLYSPMYDNPVYNGNTSSRNGGSRRI